MKIYFVRHGQTDENFRGITLGNQADVSINAEGIRQVRALKLDNDFDIIFSSPLKRCLQTAQILNEILKKQLIIHPDLIERGKGTLEGKTMQEIEEFTNGLINEDFFAKNWEADFSPYGGDSIEEVRTRVKRFINEMLEKYKDKKILVSTHMGVIKVLYCLYGDKALANLDNSALNVIEIN